MDLNDLFDAPDTKKPITTADVAKALDSGLSDDLARKAQAAAQAHDALAAAQAALDEEKDVIQKEMAPRLAPLIGAVAAARTARTETLTALGEAMEADKITTIPMTDRPDIKVKVSKGRKKSISKKWLTDAEGPPIKTFDQVLAGDSGFKTGREVAEEIWKVVPTGKDTQEVVVPDRYEDEPDR
jgi:hypothetical protein